MILATWFHGDDEEFNSSYAQVAGKSTTKQHYDIYLACLDVLVGSAVRWAEAERIVVVLNAAGVCAAGQSRLRWWADLGAEYRVIENTHRTPPGYWSSWQNQFFVLDVMRELAAICELDDAIVLVDSDCLVLSSLKGLESDIYQYGQVALAIPYSEDDSVNGCSRKELAQMSLSFGPYKGRLRIPEYLGGEFIALRADVVGNILPVLEDAFKWSLEQAASGKLYPREEAQLISMVANQAGYSLAGQKYVRRIWTQPWKFRNAADEDLKLAVWHLPAEKRTGLRRLSRAAGHGKSGWFWSAEHADWVMRCGTYLGVPRYGPLKLLRDAIDLSPRTAARLGRLLSASRSDHCI